MDPTWASIIITALGGTSILGLGIKEIAKHRSGRAAAERAEQQDFLARAVLAEKRAEWEFAARRIIQELAGTERRKLTEQGVQLERWPSLEDKLGPRP
jgi:hypothetical protein